MQEIRTANLVLLRTILDTMPAFVFVVDDDVRILDYNRAAASLLGHDQQQVLRHRAGEVLHCIHATDVPEGCGRGPACRTCVIRGSVGKALAGGHVSRTRTKMELKAGDDVAEIYALITTSGLDYEGGRLVLLVVEDISQMVELHRLIPICMYCKSVRTDDQYWQKVDAYLARNWDMRFTHGLCPECYRNEMGKLGGSHDPGI